MPLQERFRHAPGGACVERRSASEITSFVTDGGQSPQIRLLLNCDHHSFDCGTRGLRHKSENRASHFWPLLATSAVNDENKGGGNRRGGGKTAFRVSSSSAHSSPHAPGSNQAALMSLERSDARIANKQAAEVGSPGCDPYSSSRPRRNAQVFAPAFDTRKRAMHSQSNLRIWRSPQQTILSR